MSTVLATPADLQAWLAQIEEEERRRADSRRAKLEARCRDSFAVFFRAGFRAVAGESGLVWGKHLQAQCETAQAFAEGWLVAHGRGTPAMVERQRAHWAAHGREMPPGACGAAVQTADPIDELLADLDLDDEEDPGPGPAPAVPYELLVDHLVVNGGPGTLKSRIWMVYLMAWVWLHAPEAHFLCTSGTGKNVTRDSGYTKDLVSSEWYRNTFRIEWRVGVSISGKVQDSIERWTNSAGGERISLPLLSKITGQRGDFLLIDDPDDALGVESEPTRREVRDKHDKVLGNRLRWGGVEMVLQQHVHPDDLSSNLKTRGVAENDRDALIRARACGAWSIDHRKQWAAFVLAVEFRPELRCTTPWGWTDWREAKGEVLFEVMFTPDYIAGEIGRLGQAGWEAQGNQNPENAEGGEVKREWFGFCVIEGEHVGHAGRPRGCRPRTGEGAVEPVTIRKRPTGKLDLDWFEIHVDPKNEGTSEASSNVGLVALAGKGNQVFILDDRTARLGFLPTLDALREMICDWAHLGLEAAVIEFKVQGPAVIATLKREIEQGKLRDRHGKPVVIAIEDAERGSTPFELRWKAALPSFRACLVHVLDGAGWAEPYVSEICAVPNGAHDDRADATVQGINRHADSGSAGARFAALARLKQAAQHAQRQRSPYR